MNPPRVKRVYDPPAGGDGTRILVDRLWPRGIAKDRARIDLWLKDLSPRHALRKEFHGHPEHWDTFRAAFATELASPEAQAAAETVFERRRAGPVTLLYAARDESHNNAVALRLWLDEQP
jgi:uncharacterized protein YeaO (DUF488 family)